METQYNTGRHEKPARYFCLQFRLLWPGWVSSYHYAVFRIDLFLCFSVKVPCFEGRMRMLLFNECCQGCWEKSLPRFLLVPLNLSLLKLSRRDFHAGTNFGWCIYADYIMLTMRLRQWGKHKKLPKVNIKLPSVANTWEHNEDMSLHGLFLFSISIWYASNSNLTSPPLEILLLLITELNYWYTRSDQKSIKPSSFTLGGYILMKEMVT